MYNSGKFIKISIIPILFLYVFACSVEKKTVSTEPAKGKLSKRIGDTEKLIKGEKGIEDSKIYEVGVASWYGGKFQGRRTSNGEIYNMHRLTAAHRKLAFNTIVEVENLKNRKKVIVRINDRGPFVKDRIIDLSFEAAKRLGIDDIGTAPVALRIVKPSQFKSEKNVKYSYKKDVSNLFFYLQSGAFSEVKNAEALLYDINESTSNLVFRIIFESGFYKVVSENVTDKSYAIREKEHLEKLGFTILLKEKSTD